MTAPAKDIMDHPLQSLRGLGEKRAAGLRAAGLATIGDLLRYYPRRYLDRSNVREIVSLKQDEEVTVVGKVASMGLKRGHKNRFILVISDGTDYLSCIWFSKLVYWQKIFKVGEWLAVSGRVTRFAGWQMTHPEFDRLGQSGEGDPIHTGKIIPLYPSGEALSRLGYDSRGFRRLLAQTLKEHKGRIREILPAAIIHQHGLPGLAEALQHIHFPATFAALSEAQRRLKFDELFFMELLVALRRQHWSEQKRGIEFLRVGDLVRSLVAQLPFTLTQAQKKVLHEIRADMKRPQPMNRLLQGDVGSGKTIVAVISMLIAVENGYQAAIMAPTEILAEQHYLTITRLLQGLPVQVELLIGGQAKAERETVLQNVASGRAEIIVGTHALIQEGVAFPKLGLVIIDEQHRFGVMQRAVLREKGTCPDVLVMTATPIPRTLSMTVYGDLDVSVLNERPALRKRIKTHAVDDRKRPQVYHYVREQVRQGAQVYIVFPLVEETEKSDLKAASESYEKMKAGFFSDVSIGLLHGRMSTAEKDRVMADFKQGVHSILVSTTVIEVGVDVPNATIMVIEHAERFGLTQLHQLRGRVGRGEKQSHCILIAYGQPTPEARRRLQTLVETDDGFRIAEVDMELRGPGEYFGTRQHGLPELTLADVSKDFAALSAARDEAFRLVAADPQLRKAEHLSLREYFLKHYREKFDLASVG